MSCGRDSLKPNGWLFDDFPPSSSDKVLFVDVPTRTHMLIRTRGYAKRRWSVSAPPLDAPTWIAP